MNKAEWNKFLKWEKRILEYIEKQRNLFDEMTEEEFSNWIENEHAKDYKENGFNKEFVVSVFNRGYNNREKRIKRYKENLSLVENLKTYSEALDKKDFKTVVKMDIDVVSKLLAPIKSKEDKHEDI